MAVKTFAAIVIGSAETEMRVYEYTARRKMKEIDCISDRLNLGVDAYSLGRLDPKKVKDLCEILKEFRTIMEGYQVDGYRAYATSAFRESRSSLIVLDHIEKQSGLKIQIIGNAEQRFLDYKSIACESEYFEQIIANGTAIVDIGGNSLQISFFDKDKLITTQNVRMGKISTREQYLSFYGNKRQYEMIVRELLEHELNGFARLYQREKQRPIRNLLVVDADLLDLVKNRYENVQQVVHSVAGDVFGLSAGQFTDLYARMMELNADDVATQFDISADAAMMVMQSMMFANCLLNRMGAEMIWLMDVTICDGMAYDFGIANKLITQTHNFEEDILAAARNIAKRYKSNVAHIRNMEELCLLIFNKTKKVHGLKSRDRLLLQLSAILHNCGKYISLTNVADCAYNIILATEIIGLSHDEQKVIANVVKYNTVDFEFSQDPDTTGDLTVSQYQLVSKLTAILRIANALDRGHKQKCAGASASLKDDELVISVTTNEDLSLETITLKEQSSFFEEVFSIHPVLHVRKKS